jgi:purine-binding chemotaxis protein CheW
VARLEDGLVLIHDLDGFLSESEAESLDTALGAAMEGSSAAEARR